MSSYIQIETGGEEIVNGKILAFTIPTGISTDVIGIQTGSGTSIQTYTFSTPTGENYINSGGKLSEGNLLSVLISKGTTENKAIILNSVQATEAINKLSNTINGWNQLVCEGVSPGTKDGITGTYNGNGSYSFTGQATADVNMSLLNTTRTIDLEANHKYILRGCANGGSIGSYYLTLINTTTESEIAQDIGNGILFNNATTTTVTLNAIFKNETILTDTITYWPQLFDLTTIFGSGKEPSNIEFFNTIFTDKYYPYTEAYTNTISYNVDTSNSVTATQKETARTNIGAASISHSQTADTIYAGTLSGQVLANSTATQAIATSQIRNIYAGTSGLESGTSELATGAIYLQYE